MNMNECKKMNMNKCMHAKNKSVVEFTVFSLIKDPLFQHKKIILIAFLSIIFFRNFEVKT